MQVQTIPFAALPIGTVLERPKGILRHQSIYLGNSFVFENTPEFGERVTTLAEFAQQKSVTALRTIKLSTQDLYDRVKESLQKKRHYHPITNNCEQSVSRIENGFAWSTQLAFWVIAAILTALCAVSLMRRK